jgi:hypothetical protein
MKKSHTLYIIPDDIWQSQPLFSHISQFVRSLPAIDFLKEKADTIFMDIQSGSVGMSQGRVLEEAGMRVQAMGLDAMREQSAAVDRLLQSADIITDPNLGSKIDVSA